MDTPLTRLGSRFIRRRAAGYRALLLVPMSVCLAVVAAGCGGGSAASGVAHLGTSTARTSTGAAVTGSASPEAYARCMRSHGVPTFPDPNSKGQLSSSSIANLNSPQYRKAQEVCRSLLPQGSALQGAPAGQGGSLTPQQLAQFLKYARCMRAHGVSNFADPTSKGLSLSGVDPNSQRFQAAQIVCRSLLPNRGHGSFQSAGGGRKP
jgi:hypothetical protein